ncbi:CDP-diacylglycerol diphosphatase [Streptomyces sp. LX-29]|uniref:CDP-diacylglycerol diphosphatase n=1 Tax=Streptomyces sp. LX-29 TaxID=2900152 RepID=UPI00240D8E13|nr:CDP-diacylglycerol diphosphatase [Streptomyces sp. LX-29]WFB11259.1 CDP-diacylglycerol diphosphatase [Streptomyces sp. LX-29]
MSENQREGQPGALSTPDCGDKDDGDRFYLWLKVKNWSQKPLGSCNPIMRLYGKPECAVMSGGADDDLLLVPTARVKGIECRDVWNTPDLHYWNTAWEYVELKMSAAGTGLGINSAADRTEDQLHIHMVAFNPYARDHLEKNVSKLATKPDDWANKVLLVPGHDPKGSQDRSYRGLYIKESIPEKDNLFYLLAKHVPGAANRMAGQTLIVIPGSQNPGFYVLNSEPTLSPGPGTGTCDYILRCK